MIEAEASGRVNLIGEHTDYNHGFVMPMALHCSTRCRISVRNDTLVTILSKQFGYANYHLRSEKAQHHWADYIQGITCILRERGHHLTGCDLEIESTVPTGSGLSSSAALEISVLRAINGAFDLGLDPVEMARIGQEVEHRFAGVPCGIMDQMAASLLRPEEALFLDTESMEYQPVEFPWANELSIIHVSEHHNADSGYKERRAECEQAARMLGYRTLREVPKHADMSRLTPIHRKRARYIWEENERVQQALQAIKSFDRKAFGSLVNASHQGQKDLYEVSTPDIDHSVDYFLQQEGVWGARLTGGGFGGSIMVLSEVPLGTYIETYNKEHGTQISFVNRRGIARRSSESTASGVLSDT